MAEAYPTPSSRWGSTAQLEQLWHDLADDPERQAVECAELCLRAAPHLVEWLEHRIMAHMPDALLTELALYTPSDGRIQALSRLAEFRYNRVAQPAVPAVERTAPRRVLSTRQIEVTPANVEEVYERLFGVKPQIVEAPRLIKVDWELARIAVKLEEAAEFRLWAIGRDLTSHQQGSGVITKAELWQRLQVYGIQYSPRHFNRLLKAGTGMYWHLAGENLYLTGYQRLSPVMVERVDEDEIVGNLPGVWPMLLDPSGGLEQWESTVYAGWVAGRGWKKAVTISRQMQAVLFGRSENTIRKWEADHLEGVVSKRSNIAQCP
ncbi:MAG: hypothetical protein K8H77_10805, partial [Cutibacterium acnes]|nr:hypothetical protein [Cutibacterium acnes]